MIFKPSPTPKGWSSESLLGRLDFPCKSISLPDVLGEASRAASHGGDGAAPPCPRSRAAAGKLRAGSSGSLGREVQVEMRRLGSRSSTAGAGGSPPLPCPLPAGLPEAKHIKPVFLQFVSALLTVQKKASAESGGAIFAKTLLQRRAVF